MKLEARLLCGRAFHYVYLAHMVIDSQYPSLEESLAGLVIPFAIRESLALVSIEYRSFDGLFHQGQMVVHQALAEEVRGIFHRLLQLDFPIMKVIPVTAYGWDDIASMQDNNTSAFNYRAIIGTDQLSNHSFGRAIDLNPLLNPYYARDGKIYPQGALHKCGKPGTLCAGDPVVTFFKEQGWDWGGDWEKVKDYQHFQKL